MDEFCVFCKIRDGEIPSEILHRDDHCFVIKDINPAAPIHLLVIPVEHFTYLSGLQPDFHGTIGAMFSAASEAAGNEGIADSGYRLIVNQRDDAGQEVPHLHLHVIGGRRLGAMG